MVRVKAATATILIFETSLSRSQLPRITPFGWVSLIESRMERQPDSAD